MLFELAKATFKHSGYMITSTSLEVKWSAILADLVKVESFKPFASSLNWRALNSKFVRETKEVCKKAGDNSEHINLSDRKDCPTAYESM